jgi:hypothetical protein
MTVQGMKGQERVGQDRARHDRKGKDKTRKNITGQEHIEQPKLKLNRRE